MKKALTLIASVAFMMALSTCAPVQQGKEGMMKEEKMMDGEKGMMKEKGEMMEKKEDMMKKEKGMMK